MLRRIRQVGLESFNVLAPIPPLGSLPSFEEACEELPDGYLLLAAVAKEFEPQRSPSSFGRRQGGESIWGGRENDLTTDEQKALFVFTLELPRPEILSSAINRALRDPNRNRVQPFLSFIKLLNSAISKFPATEKCTLWCGTNQSCLYETYQPRLFDTIVFWGFTCALPSKEYLSSLISDDQSSARTIFSLSISSAAACLTRRAQATPACQCEFLVRAGTTFLVERVSLEADGVCFIEMKEIVAPLLNTNLKQPASYPFDPAAAAVGSSHCLQADTIISDTDWSSADPENIFREGYRYRAPGKEGG